MTEVVVKIPTTFDGLAPGDRVAMLLGGSGDRFAAGLSRRGEEIAAVVYRLPPYLLKATREREGRDKEDDHWTLATLLERTLAAKSADPRPFYVLRRRDRDQIRVKETYLLRQSAVKDRIACQQRIIQAAEGRIFLSEEGYYPEGRLEDSYKQLRADDKILQGLLEEEDRRGRGLQEAVRAHPLWDAVFADILGCGERIAAGLLVAIGDVRRFWVAPDQAAMDALAERSRECERRGRFAEDRERIVAGAADTPRNHYQELQLVCSWKREHEDAEEATALAEAISCHRERHRLRHQAFLRGMYNLRAHCGVHVLSGGKHGNVPKEKSFPRHRRGPNEPKSGTPAARQALYLLADQFNRRPRSTWGQRLRQIKVRFREHHPTVEEYTRTEGGRTVTKKRYTDIHIHKMGLWRTLTKFTDHIYRTWTRIEREQEHVPANA